MLVCDTTVNSLFTKQLWISLAGVLHFKWKPHALMYKLYAHAHTLSSKVHFSVACINRDTLFRQAATELVSLTPQSTPHRKQAHICLSKRCQSILWIQIPVVALYICTQINTGMLYSVSCGRVRWRKGYVKSCTRINNSLTSTLTGQF